MHHMLILFRSVSGVVSLPLTGIGEESVQVELLYSEATGMFQRQVVIGRIAPVWIGQWVDKYLLVFFYLNHNCDVNVQNYDTWIRKLNS